MNTLLFDKGIFNPFFRIVKSAIIIPSVITIGMFFLISIFYSDRDWIYIFLGISIILFNIMIAFQIRYYISKIEYNENCILLEYYHWFKKKDVCIPFSSLSIKMVYLTLGRGATYGIRISNNLKVNMIQYEAAMFEDSKWQREDIKELFNKLLTLKKEHSS